MLKNDWERRICESYLEIGIDDIPHCRECPLCYDFETGKCKANATFTSKGLVFDALLELETIKQKSHNIDKEKSENDDKKLIFEILAGLKEIAGDWSDYEKSDFEFGWDTAIDCAISFIVKISGISEFEVKKDVLTDSMVEETKRTKGFKEYLECYINDKRKRNEYQMHKR